VWILGILLLLAGSVSLGVFAGSSKGRPAAEIWDIPGTARTYTTIVGTLAGFSVTSSIFIANLSVARQSTNFEGVMALFLVAFVVFASSAIQFGTTPNLPAGPSSLYRTIQGYSYLLANTSFYLALCLSWLGLPLLLSAIGLDYLSDTFIWLVLFAILGGAMRVSSSGLNVFAGMELILAVVLPLACFIFACLYWLAGSELWDQLLPERHVPTHFAVICFGVAGLGFSLQSALVGALRGGEWTGLATAAGRLLVVGFSGAVISSNPGPS
jgi:hypothetical protein